jgi:hypothetical protein
MTCYQHLRKQRHILQPEDENKQTKKLFNWANQEIIALELMRRDADICQAAAEAERCSCAAERCGCAAAPPEQQPENWAMPLCYSRNWKTPSDGAMTSGNLHASAVLPPHNQSRLNLLYAGAARRARAEFWHHVNTCGQGCRCNYMVEDGTLAAVNTEVHRSRRNLISGMRWMAFIENHKNTEGGGGQRAKAKGR